MTTTENSRADALTDQIANAAMKCLRPFASAAQEAALRESVKSILIASPVEQHEAAPAGCVKLEHVAVAEDGGKLRWMTGRKPRDCELYAMPDGGRAPETLYLSAPSAPLEGTGNGADGRALYERLHKLMPQWYPDAWDDLLPKYRDAYATAALSRAPRTEVAGAVPYGWKWVPIEPTEKMISEGSCAQSLPGPHYISESAAKACWKYMIAATPPSADAAAAPADERAATDLRAEAWNLYRKKCAALQDELPDIADFFSGWDAAHAAASQPAAAAAAAAGQEAVAIYQARQLSDDTDRWDDVYEATHSACAAQPEFYETRIVYTAPPAQVATWQGLTDEQRHAIEWAIGMASQHNIHNSPLRALLEGAKQ